ncbi:MAG: ASCH domain-containing protein [Clostridia bacterium]|nr:ASCH domain-containing protein [Clostridia bacterium]
MIHKMRLDPLPYGMIKSGRKTVELRLFDEKRQKIKIGDLIAFTNTDSGETITAAVIKLHRFGNFEELYEALPLLKCGYTEETVKDASSSDMEKYYSREEEAKYGVVGIELSLQD